MAVICVVWFLYSCCMGLEWLVYGACMALMWFLCFVLFCMGFCTAFAGFLYCLCMGLGQHCVWFWYGVCVALVWLLHGSRMVLYVDIWESVGSCMFVYVYSPSVCCCTFLCCVV